MSLIFRLAAICLICLVVSDFCLRAQDVSSLRSLPLQLSATIGNNKDLVIYLTGDGGWNGFNQKIVQEIEKHGLGVVVLNTRKYFWDQKSPDLFATDFGQLSSYYLKEWGKSSLIIVGYSFGADVASFLPGRLSDELHNKIKKVILISPSVSSDFVIRLSDLIGISEQVDRKYKLEPELNNTDLPVICIFGSEEQLILKTKLTKKMNIRIFELPGDHRYNDNFALLFKMMGI